MARLNQIIAIEKGVKARAMSSLSTLYKIVQKSELFSGFSKTYLPVDEDGDKLPPESKKVVQTVVSVLRAAEASGTELMDVIARKDWSNTAARADIKLGDRVLVADVPVTYMLFLEKQLTDLHTFISSLPLLDDAEDWERDAASGLMVTSPVQTHRTKKVQRPIVLYQATPEHPAQTQLISEDIVAGYWSSKKQSGAMSRPDRDAMVERVEELMVAVKEAREAANSVEETSPSVSSVGSVIFDYIITGE